MIICKHGTTTLLYNIKKLHFAKDCSLWQSNAQKHTKSTTVIVVYLLSVPFGIDHADIFNNVHAISQYERKKNNLIN